MRAYVVRGPGRMEQVDLPAPIPGPEEVLVRVAYCSVCGSDITALEGRAFDVPEGMILGHEVSGTVAAVGERVRGLALGDRVALEPAVPCRRCWYCLRGQYHMCPQTLHLGASLPGGFAEYLTIHELNAHRIPAGLSLREAALLEPLGVCLAGLRKARLAVGETMAVFGDGPFGAIFARLGIIMGARAVWVLGHHDWRLERIRAPHVVTVNTAREAYLPALFAATEGRGADLAVAATDSTTVYAEMLASVRIQGRLLAFSYPRDSVTLDLSQVHMRELELIGSCRCPHTFATLIELIAEGRLAPGELISAVMPLEALPEAFAMARGRSKELFKILVELAAEV